MRLKTSALIHVRPSVLALSACLTLITPSLADIADLSGEDPYTHWDYRDELLEYNRRTMVEAYKKVGHCNPAWDKVAIEYLDVYATRFTNGGLQSRFWFKDEIDERRQELAAELGELGCDDPMVAYCRSHDLQADSERCLQLAKTAYEHFQVSAYPYLRKAAAARWLWNRQAEAEKEFTDAKQALIDLLVELLKKEDAAPQDGRFIFMILFDGVGWDLPLTDLDQLMARAKNLEFKHPWVFEVFGGDYHTRSAWKARGGKCVYHVTEEGWKGFTEHLRKAEALYSRAWRCCPQFPQPATGMIAVSMGLGNNQKRIWFDRAVTA